MELFFWLIILIISLIVLVKSADYFTDSSEKIGLALGMSPFVIGIIIVSAGTSLPELAAAFSAIFKDSAELVPASVIGSNIANILLIVGISAVVARKLVVTKDLIDIDLPLLAIVTAIFLVAIFDGKIVFFEALIFVFTYIFYLIYSQKSKEKDEDDGLKQEDIPVKLVKGAKMSKVPRLKMSLLGILILSAIGLMLGANYTVDAVVELGKILAIPASIITITVVAIGTSLPELVVSIKSAMKKKFDIALGNIFGSNIFNMLVVAGLPGLFTTLPIDEKTYVTGGLFLVLSTFLFIISGISKRIHIWEGLLFLCLYVLFTYYIIQ